MSSPALAVPVLAVPTLASQRRQVERNDQLTNRQNLNSEQGGLELGQGIPIVFGKRENGAGGVWISAPATECRFENDLANRVTASYELVLSDGQVGTIAVGDVWQGDTPLVAGEFQQAYNTRAGSWTPGNFIEQRFNVTYLNQQITAEGKAIGADSAGALDVGGLSDAELETLIQECSAKASVKSSGQYVTYFNISVDREVLWPRTGVQVATRGVMNFSVTGGSNNTSGISFTDPATLPWNLATDATLYYGGADYGSPPAIRAWSFGSEIFTVGNGWIRERADEARYMAVGPGSGQAAQQYTINRSPSLQPYGGIELDWQEFIRPGFITRQTLPGVSLFGGLPGVTYTLVVEEINSEPLPKPEATLYCGTGGTFAGLTTLSVVKQYPAGDEGGRRHIHAFIRNGVAVPRLIEGTDGASNQFPDLARRLMVASSKVRTELINNSMLLASAQFCAAQGFTCDCVVANPTNLPEWLDRVAPFYLLKPSNSWGRMGLRPALPITPAFAIDTGTITPTVVLDETDIVPGSWQYTYSPRADRLPFCAVILWREQPEDNAGTQRATEVRYRGEATGGPFEEIDASEFVTREAHAMRIGAYRLAMRRHVTHKGIVQVLPSVGLDVLQPGAIIRLNRARNPSVGVPSTWSYLYEIERVSGPTNGPWALELTHFPVDSQGRSVVARDVVAATFGS